MQYRRREDYRKRNEKSVIITDRAPQQLQNMSKDKRAFLVNDNPNVINFEGSNDIIKVKPEWIKLENKMKITKKELKLLIKEEIKRITEEEKEDLEMIDLDYSNLQTAEKQIDDAWPDVSYDSYNIIDIISDAADEIQKKYPKLDGQEVYLGYDPKTDTFYQGWDAWFRDSNEMEGPIWSFNVENGYIKNIKRISWSNINSGSFYAPKGSYKQKPANIIDLRLD